MTGVWTDLRNTTETRLTPLRRNNRSVGKGFDALVEDL
jgi:hypothetical protein